MRTIWVTIALTLICCAMSTMRIFHAEAQDDIHANSNSIWNEFVFIALDTTDAYGYPSGTRGVVTEWKYDDNGNGDPRDDLNRIRGGSHRNRNWTTTGNRAGNTP